MTIKQINQGFTLLELLMVITIVGVLASIAVPSFSDTIERNRLKEAAESLKSDLMFAKTEAIKRSQNIGVTLVKSGADWCYGINDDNTACACGTVATANCAIKSVDGTQFKNVSLDSAPSTTFTFRRGTATSIGPILSTDNYQVKLSVSNRGRVRMCNDPGVTNGLPGYYDC